MAAVRAVDLRTSIRPTVATIDLAALERNVGRLRAKLAPGVALYGVVKADAYGHGSIAIARTLAPLCDALAVSLAEEGLELRAAGIASPILVLGAYYRGRHADVLEEGLTPVVYDQGDLEQFGQVPARRSRRDKALAGAGEQVGIHLKIDTGMNRLGVKEADLPTLIKQLQALPRLRVDALCTHLASADVADPAMTIEQLQRFASATARAATLGVNPALRHVANSAAAVRFPATHFGAIRPGLALYGAMPSSVVAEPELEPVLALRTRIMAMHAVPVGESVSYGAQWRATRPSQVATLPIGYADGYPRHVVSAEVLVRSRRVPIVGAVCMDMMMIDVTNVPGVQLGDAVTLIGHDGDQRISVDDLAGWAHTVNYEVLCNISKRVPRIYEQAPGATPSPVGQGDE